MKNNVSDDNFKKISELIKELVEPDMNKIVAILNERTNKMGIHVGCEIKWFIDTMDKQE